MHQDLHNVRSRAQLLHTTLAWAVSECIRKMSLQKSEDLSQGPWIPTLCCKQLCDKQICHNADSDWQCLILKENKSLRFVLQFQPILSNQAETNKYFSECFAVLRLKLRLCWVSFHCWIVEFLLDRELKLRLKCPSCEGHWPSVLSARSRYETPSTIEKLCYIKRVEGRRHSHRNEKAHVQSEHLLFAMVSIRHASMCVLAKTRWLLVGDTRANE